ncbi:hypothetical protein 162300112 [Organic Lake phycodnavirus 2]|nr:hypothetical protein 162300112 [Organic Lake phycodnavirus 2]
MDYPKVLTKYYIDKEWTCGDTYETIVWYDETLAKPTEEELELKYDELLLDEMREERNRLLRESDYTALPDYPQRDKWLAYRQELRDFPSIWTEGIEFPTSPE